MSNKSIDEKVNNYDSYHSILLKEKHKDEQHALDQIHKFREGDLYKSFFRDNYNWWDEFYKAFESEAKTQFDKGYASKVTNKKDKIDKILVEAGIKFLKAARGEEHFKEFIDTLKKTESVEQQAIDIMHHIAEMHGISPDREGTLRDELLELIGKKGTTLDDVLKEIRIHQTNYSMRGQQNYLSKYANFHFAPFQAGEIHKYMAKKAKKMNHDVGGKFYKLHPLELVALDRGLTKGDWGTDEKGNQYGPTKYHVTPKDPPAQSDKGGPGKKK